MSFEQEVQKAVQDSLLDLLRKGDWCKIDWAARVNLGADFTRKVQESVDLDRVLGLVQVKIEQRIADAIFNAMATEVANDVKRALSNTVLRDEVRDIIRDLIREAANELG